MLVAAELSDAAGYAAYRAEMTVLLEAVGGRFRWDWEVARTLRGEGGLAAQRVFVIEFPDRAAKEAYFADPRYQEIRARLFAPSVRRIEVLAEYER